MQLVGEGRRPGTGTHDDRRDAAASGRFTVVVTARVSYQVKVTVTDAVTGAVEGSQTIFAAAVPKGV